MARPVRQFITSGSADHEVPDRSAFRHQFVAALAGAGDLTGDGYITGTELGIFLEEKVTNYSDRAQTPQYGKPRHRYLDKGDFVFALTEPPHSPPGQAPSPPPPPWQGNVQVNVNVPATVYLNDERIGETEPDEPLNQRGVAAGRAAVRVEAAGYQSATQWAEVKRGEWTQLIFELEPETAMEPRKGDTWTEPTTGMEFVWIPPGCFQMGSSKSEAGRGDNERQHRVCVEGFWLGKHEVTNTEFRRFRPDHHSNQYRGHSLNGNSQPVVYVDWHAATDFAAWLSRKIGERFRLPTEAEWEYAARAGTETARFWGNGPDEACAYANVHDKSSKRQFDFKWTPHNCHDGYGVTAPRGRFQPNPFGLHDLLGNVCEWTCSAYDVDYRGSEKDCMKKGSSELRVLRGGAWGGKPEIVRSANRQTKTSDHRANGVGFRLARSP